MPLTGRVSTSSSSSPNHVPKGSVPVCQCVPQCVRLSRFGWAMVLRDAARFIVLLCQQLGLAARTAPVRLLLSSVPCAPVCGASVCQRCASSCETDRVAYIYSRLPPPPRIPPFSDTTLPNRPAFFANLVQFGAQLHSARLGSVWDHVIVLRTRRPPNASETPKPPGKGGWGTTTTTTRDTFPMIAKVTDTNVS